VTTAAPCRSAVAAIHASCRRSLRPARSCESAIRAKHDARSRGSWIIDTNVAEYGEWSRKRATLSEVTARKEYGVESDFVIAGINAGKLEYREGAMHGHPYIRVLRRQLEAYIVEELGADHLRSWQEKIELREVTREIVELRKRLDQLEARKAEIQAQR
jgi:hypothetical protein